MSLSLCKAFAIAFFSYLVVMFVEYGFILSYFFFCIFVVLVLVSLSIVFVYHNIDSDKVSSYECGFHPFSDARIPFEVRFYLVGVLFIIFDLELVFLFPWVLCFNSLNYQGFCVMVYFLALLVIGLWYEWVNGALDL